jgi:hypothetical protein
VPTPTDPSPELRDPLAALAAGLVALTLLPAGCGRGPSPQEVQNARAFEALLTAVSLKDAGEVERDARAIDERHTSGKMSDGKYREIAEVIARARAKDWAAAEKRAYEFRAQFGDRGAYFR